MSEVWNNVRRKSTWLRGLYLLLFAVLWGVAELVITLVAILQFLFTLFGGERNAYLSRFGGQLSTYAYRVTQFVTFHADDKPFPFAAWPSGPIREVREEPPRPEPAEPPQPAPAGPDATSAA